MAIENIRTGIATPNNPAENIRSVNQLPIG
jgi:hypothetical protein